MRYLFSKKEVDNEIAIIFFLSISFFFLVLINPLIVAGLFNKYSACIQSLLQVDVYVCICM